MIYCLNPKCINPIDPMNINGKICRNCGNHLLIKNRYKVIKVLGRGGFARTFEIIDTQGIQKVLKVLDFSRVCHENFQEIVVNLFRREADVLSRLNHPGIPKVESDGYFQIEYKNCEEPLYCLMMEKIDGLNLQQWLINQNYKNITLTQARAWLKQLVEILEQVHKKNYFHRDIKPANIMLRPDGQLVLIDFGAVKDLTETFLQQEDTLAEGTLIGSRGYAPPEQMRGQPRIQSDFFALGRTFVHLLTGVHPIDLEDQKTGKLIWRDKVPQIGKAKLDLISFLQWQNLCNLIDDMMEDSYQNRPENTQAILQRLNQKVFIPHYIGYTVSTAILLLLAVTGSYWYFTGVNGCTKIWLRNFPLRDNMSCGEEMMISSTAIEKQKGVEAFALSHDNEAMKFFEEAWQKQPDPETLIYLNNARLEAGNAKAYTIAAVVPLGDNNDTINSSKDLLQGVAQAQDEFNQSHKHEKIGLKVLVARDQNQSEGAKNIAQLLSQESTILAVVGHFRSDTTLTAMEVYKKNHLLLISPTATSEDLSRVCQSDHPHCFFRTVDSDRITTKALAHYLKKVNKLRAAVFYNPDSNYSQSLQKEMRTKLSDLRGKVVVNIPFSDNLDDAIKQVKKHKANVIVLFPTTDGLTSDAAEQVIESAKQLKYLIVGGDSLETPKMLRNFTGNQAGSVMAIPWEQKSTLNLQFSAKAKKLWGKQLYWRTALAYDATRALLAALEKLPSPNRLELQQAMASPHFKAFGATGKITFAENGDRQESIVQLVKVVQNPHTGEMEFIKQNSQ